MWNTELGELPVDWLEQGPAWEHHLGVLINGDTTDWAPLGCTPLDEERTMLEYSPPREAALTSRLRVRRTDSGIACTVVGEGQAAESTQIEPWRAAVLGAFARLGTMRTFDWQALIGPHPHGPNTGVLAVDLAAETRLGPLTLVPGDVLMRQTVPHGLAQGERRNGLVQRSWPIRVFGEAQAFNWTNALAQAHRPLHRLCALISLVWEGYWTKLEGPTTFGAPGALIEIPRVVFGAAGTAWQDEKDEEQERERARVPRELPPWLEAVWHRVEREQGLSDVLDAWYEAVRLAPEHPSAAYAAYVAAIEAVGALTVPLERCDCCERCRADVGAGKRFRTALRTVLTARQIKAATLDAYDLRSQTAHTGRLHGLETHYGQHEFSMYRADARWLFTGHKLTVIGKIANAVVLTALAGPHCDAQGAP